MLRPAYPAVLHLIGDTDDRYAIGRESPRNPGPVRPSVCKNVLRRTLLEAAA